MLLVASAAIFYDEPTVVRLRAMELKRATHAISVDYYDKHRNRAPIQGSSIAQRRKKQQRHEMDQSRIDKRVTALQLMPKNLASNAAWVFATTAHGPPETYMRVVPLPVRSFI